MASLRAALGLGVLDLRLCHSRYGCGSYIDKIPPLPIVSSSWISGFIDIGGRIL
jgi:hypothetical protein